MKKKACITVLALSLILVLATVAATLNPFLTKPKSEQADWLISTFGIEQKTSIEVTDLDNLRMLLSKTVLAKIWEVCHTTPATSWEALTDGDVTKANCYVLSVFYNLTGSFTD